MKIAIPVAFLIEKEYFCKTHYLILNLNPMTLARHVLLLSLPFLLLTTLHAQTTNESFASPVIEDEMTVNPEQNKLWRTGQAKYSAKPRSMWELGLHGGSAFVGGDVEAPFPAGYG